MSESMLLFDHVSKQFTFTPDRPHTILETAVNLVRRGRRERQELWALRDVSFALARGDSVGIIGRNGSGKSTILKLATRILRPTSGRVAVRGRVSALLELGAGFHPDLTGRENIALNGSVLGLKKHEVDALFDQIVDFSELGSFIDMPVKHYSSGMYMRLGFSVAVHVSPDVLIVDEILAVGDQAFQEKCIDRIRRMQADGATILFVSHHLKTVSNICSRVIWLEKGVVRRQGTTDDVLPEYHDAFRAPGGAAGGGARHGSFDIEISGVRFLDGADQPTAALRTGDALTVEVAYVAHRPIPHPEFALSIFREDGLRINWPNNRMGGLVIDTLDGSGCIRYHIPSLPLLPANYDLTAAIYSGVGPQTYDFHDRAFRFRVLSGGSPETEGVVAILAQWQWRPDDR